MNGEEMVSNASVVFWKKKLLIITAAHSVFDWHYKKFAESISFFDYEGNEVNIKRIVLSNNWVSEGILDFDTAILIPDKTNHCNYNKIYPKFFYDKEQKITVLYLKDKLFKKKLMCHEANTFEDYIYESSMIGVNLKAKEGYSGSPWYYKDEKGTYQITNTSLSFKKYKKLSFAPYWGMHMKDMFLFSENVNNVNEKYINHILY